MKAYLDSFVTDVAPALKTAFIHAGKVAAYIILSAAIAAAYAFVAKSGFDPIVMVYVNVALAAAQKATATLND